MSQTPAQSRCFVGAGKAHGATSGICTSSIHKNYLAQRRGDAEIQTQKFIHPNKFAGAFGELEKRIAEFLCVSASLREEISSDLTCVDTLGSAVGFSYFHKLPCAMGFV